MLSRRPSSSVRIHCYAPGMNHTHQAFVHELFVVIRHAVTTETCQRAEAVKLSQTVVDVFPHVRGLCCDIIQICVKAPLFSRSADVIQARLAAFRIRLYRLTYHIYRCHILSLLVQSDAASNGFGRGFQAFSPLII